MIYTVNGRHFETENKFATTWKTDNSGSSNDNQITLPLISGTVNMLVEWGDGTSDTITAYNQSAVTHTYPQPGTYTVRCSGDCGSWRFDNSGDKDKIITVKSYGDFQIKEIATFDGCNNLTKVEMYNKNISGANIALAAAFRDCINLEEVFISNVSNSISLSQLFSGCDKFNSSVSHWDTSNTTSTSQLFSNCNNFNQPVDNFNTENVTNMSRMFWICPKFNQPVNHFNTSKLSSMYGIFRSCNVFNQPLDNWDTSKVTSMNDMFRNCYVFNQPLDNWDTSKVDDMRYLFNRAYAFNQDISMWNINSLTNAVDMLTSTSFSTENYDKLLIAWNAQTHLDDVPLGVGTTKYSSAAAAARASLVADGWIITDGGLV